MNEKALRELRNSKLEEMKAITDLVKSENRVASEDEMKKFEGIKNEISSIDNTLKMFSESAENVVRPVAVNAELTDAQKDETIFLNVVRGIVNKDEPTTKEDGKVLIPTTIANRIITRLIAISPIYEQATRYNVAGNVSLPYYDEETSTIGMKFVEEGTPVDSGAAKFKSIELTGFLAGALAKISKSLVNNSKFDVVGKIIEIMAQSIKIFIDKELLTGTSSKVDGLSKIAANMTVTAASANAVTADELIDVQEKVIDDYQDNAIWIMNPETRAAIRKLKNGNGEYLLQKDFTSKWGYTLLGKPVYTAAAAPKMTSTTPAIFYGDMSGLAIKLSEDLEMQVLRERYADQHQLGIVAFTEFDAKIADAQKIAQIKMGA